MYSSRVPIAKHRHATPSGPWPWLDIVEEVDPTRIDDPDSHLPLAAAACAHKKLPTQDVCWCKYPQSLYPNWTRNQQKKSGIRNVVLDRANEKCTVHYLDVMEDSMFVSAGSREVCPRTLDSFWDTVQEGRSSGVRIRALFVDGLSGPVLQMLGTRYNIEPFFFSSTLGWIPSRHQTNVVPNISDHITITLPFVRSLANTRPEAVSQTGDLVIDTHTPLLLRSNGRLIVPDQLAVHMIRSPTSNTIISLHQNREHCTTPAEAMHTRVHATGRSVYWSSIFQDTSDPTFVFLSLLWYALYAWDEALEHLYNHISFLEGQVIDDEEMLLTREHHVIRAHLLHYESLLTNFRKSVEFLQATPNPSFMVPGADGEAEDQCRRRALVMNRECSNLLVEIDRLQKSRSMQDKKIKNVMDLGFSMLNIQDSRRSQKLTEAAMRDSAAIKQISYLTMAFVPASFVASVFGMNVVEITGNHDMKGTLAHYAAVAISLTAVTIWIIVAYQIQIKDPRAELLAELAPMQPSDKTQTADVEVDAALDMGRHTPPLGIPNKQEPPTGYKRLDLWSRIWWPIVMLSAMMERRNSRREMLKSRRTRRD